MLYIGPLVLSVIPPLGYGPPSPGRSVFDLSVFAEQSKQTGRDSVGIFFSDEPIPDYELLCEGNPAEVRRGQRLLDVFASFTPGGYVPAGDTLADMIFDCHVGGADPVGDSATLPLMPGHDGLLSAGFRGFSGMAKSERFRLGEHAASAKVLTVVKAQLAATRVLALEGKLRRPIIENGRVVETVRDDDYHRRVMTAQMQKYGVDFETLRPTDWSVTETPLPKNTSISDDFTRADGDTIGNLLSWTETVNDFDTVSNKVVAFSADVTKYSNARAESDLSSDDHYAECVFDSISNGEMAGVCANFSASVGNTMNRVLVYNDTGTYTMYVVKSVAGADTNLDSDVITPSLPQAYKSEQNGTTVNGYQAGVLRSTGTTTVTGNLRTGIMYYNGGGTTPTFDDFAAADLAADGHPARKRMGGVMHAYGGYQPLPMGRMRMW